jgi:hypothetical protein
MLDISEMTYEQRDLIVLRSAMQFVISVLSDEQRDRLYELANGAKNGATESEDEDIRSLTPELFDEVIKLFKDSDIR